jgi:hypothetical protein
MQSKLLGRAGAACPAYSTITNWVRVVIRGEDIQGYASGGGPFSDDTVGALRPAAVDESPFHSVRSLASTFMIAPATGWLHLHSRGYVVRELHVVPYRLSAAPKATRLESATELKKVLWGRDIMVGATF